MSGESGRRLPEPATGSPLLDLCAAEIEQQFSAISADVRSTLVHIGSDYLSNLLTYPQASAAFSSIAGFSAPIDHLREILEVPDEPIPPNDEEEDPSVPSRRRMKTWTAYEDNRLLAGLHRYGVNNWAPIARFVGNSRTRAQCAQRWVRGLDPRICKSSWDPSEDVKLVQLAQIHGERAWSKISGSMGNRSDVQCRYHYYQLVKDMPQLIPNKCQFPSFTRTRTGTVPIKPVFQGIATRNSMPSVPQRLVAEPQPEDLGPTPRRRVSQSVVPAAPDFAASNTDTVIIPAPEAIPAVDQLQKPVHRVHLPGIETLTSLLKGWQ